MKENDIKKQIELKNLLVSKNCQTFKPNKINIKTITVRKTKKYSNKAKKFFSSKNLNKIKYLNNSSINYNISNKNYNNNYNLNEEDISIFNSSESERVPSPINSMNISSYLTHTKKKKKQKRYKRQNIKKNKKNSLINNSSFNSNLEENNNNSIILNSSFSSSDNDYSESSYVSYRSRDNKKKNFLEKMMVEENELDYLKKSEVGLISSEEEDINNSTDNNNNSMEENFNNEIERILIEIYNKNISLISSGKYNEINRNSREIEDIEKQIKLYLKKESLNTNLLVLNILGNKIKELVGKYKEKVFEIEEMNELKRQIIISNQLIHCNNSVGSNVATNSNSSYDSNNEEEFFIQNNLLLNAQEEINGKGISNILLRELINIKKTLKISSKEIEGIFKYPLSILKNDNGKKIKFSIELMQCEEFSKTILNDKLISALLTQIKEIFSKNKVPKITKWLEELEENCDQKNEMTRFIKYINEKLGRKDDEKENSNDNNIEKDDMYFINEILEENNDKEINETKNNKNSNNNNSNNNNSNNKKRKKQKTKNENNNKNDSSDSGDNDINNELQFKDLDELVNYINDETNSKKGKKKQKKSKKNKKQKNSNKKNIDEKQNYEEDNNNYINHDLDEEFQREFEIFKKDIEKDSINPYNINKINPCLSLEFLEYLSTH
jgi:hypothetical protein